MRVSSAVQEGTQVFEQITLQNQFFRNKFAKNKNKKKKSRQKHHKMKENRRERKLD